MIEQYDYEPLEAIALARTTVLAKTILELTLHRSYSSYVESIDGFADDILNKRTLFYDGTPITDMSRSNVAAGQMVRALPQLISLPPQNPWDASTAAVPKDVLSNHSNAWLQPTMNVLRSTGLYDANEPTAELRYAAPALYQYAFGALGSMKQIQYRQGRALLPRDPEFSRAFRRLSARSQQFTARLPQVLVELINVDDLMAAHQQQPEVTLLADEEGSVFSTMQSAGEIKSYPASVIYYHDPSVGKSAEYLGDLLLDIERLDTMLRS